MNYKDSAPDGAWLRCRVAVQAEAQDKNYLRHWAQELKLPGELERLVKR